MTDDPAQLNKLRNTPIIGGHFRDNPETAFNPSWDKNPDKISLKSRLETRSHLEPLYMTATDDLPGQPGILHLKQNLRTSM
jgi:hypothetical protein